MTEQNSGEMQDAADNGVAAPDRAEEHKVEVPQNETAVTEATPDPGQTQTQVQETRTETVTEPAQTGTDEQ